MVSRDLGRGVPGGRPRRKVAPPTRASRRAGGPFRALRAASPRPRITRFRSRDPGRRRLVFSIHAHAPIAHDTHAPTCERVHASVRPSVHGWTDPSECGQAQVKPLGTSLGVSQRLPLALAVRHLLLQEKLRERNVLCTLELSAVSVQPGLGGSPISAGWDERAFG